MDRETVCGEAISGKTAECMAPAQGGRRMLEVPTPPADEFDSSEAGARFDGGVLEPLASGDGEEDSVLGEEEEELADEPLSADEYVEAYDINEDDDDSDSEYEEPVLESGDGEAAGNDDLVAAAVQFLGRPTRFASVQSTAGFMRLAAAEAAPGQHGGGGEILVHYRYTRFSRARSGAHAVDVRGGGPKLHRVRFLVPSHAATDPTNSLRLAGAALAPLVYPGRLYEQLQALWSGLVAASSVRVPPRVTRLKVTVDVGILRRGDRTPERMACMRAALEAVARQADSAPARYGMEQHLPAPVPVRCDEEDGTRPTKRRRRFAGEECAICYEVLESDVAAWPRCSHVFHGGCLKQLLLKGIQRCPMCRSTLSEDYLQ